MKGKFLIILYLLVSQLLGQLKSQPEKNYFNFNVKPHFLKKNDKNISKIRFEAYFSAENLPKARLKLPEIYNTHPDEVRNNPKYNSQELDRETNFYFYNARYYDPQICRFVTADNIVDGELSAIGWNRYAYVKGNPVVGKDPTGHEVEAYRYLKEDKKKGIKEGYYDDSKYINNLFNNLDKIKNKYLKKVLNEAINGKHLITIIRVDKLIEAQGKYKKISENKSIIYLKNQNDKSNKSVLVHELGHFYNEVVLKKGKRVFTSLGNEVFSRRLENIVRKHQGRKAIKHYGGCNIKDVVTDNVNLDPFRELKGRRYVKNSEDSGKEVRIRGKGTSEFKPIYKNPMDDKNADGLIKLKNKICIPENYK